MDRPQMIGMGFAIASTIVGLVGLAGTRPLPPSARLGELAAIDSSNDGRISADEWRASGRERSAMAALDQNHDGFLSPSEAEAYRKSRRSGE